MMDFNKDLTLEQAVDLYESMPLEELCHVADGIRKEKNPPQRVTYQIDRNVNYTNVCISGCKFCNFHCTPLQKEKAYTLSIEDYIPKIKELKDLGGDQLLLQGGLHPKYGIEFYEDLFRRLKEIEPSLKLNALGPPEVAHIARLSKLSYRQTLERLVAAGLDTLPGAGAEILSDRVRKELSPAKPGVSQWMEVMATAHQMGLSTTATMVYGHIETIEERMQHLLSLRDLQKKKPEGAPGFRAFICWPMQLEGTQLQQLERHYSEAEFLRMIAVSRIVLNNIDHIQASWLTVGIEAGKKALHAGADDMGSIMIEENVVAAAGAHNSLGERQMIQAIKEAGFTPALRDQQYNLI